MGIALGVILLALAGVLEALGLFLLWSQRMVPIGCVAVVAFIVPALGIVLLAPAVVIIIRELTR